MVIFPFIAFVVSLCCVVVIGRDTLRRPRPDRVVWTVAFAIFAAAAGVEVLGDLAGWNENLARLYYLTGAVLVVGYLALGELYLLAGKRIARFGPGVILLLTALSITLVLDAPIDQTRLVEEGWGAIESTSGLTAITMFMNIGGSIILIGGALWSAWKFKKLGIMRRRMIGCIEIAIGTFIVASGGTLTRLGHREYLYIAMSIGIVVILIGVLETRRSDQDVNGLRSLFGLVPATDSAKIIPFQPGSVTRNALTNDAQALDYIIEHLLPLDEIAIAQDCRNWSVSRQEIDMPDRDRARQIWQLRTRLDPSSQQRFDVLPVATRQQLSELYFDVFLIPDVPEQAV